MVRPPLQRLAAYWCLTMAALLLALVVLPPNLGIPPFLAALFIGVWLFGAAMLWWYPTFGALGTAGWGILSGAQAIRAHGMEASQTITLVLGSFLGAALALTFLVQRRRSAT